MRQALFTLGCVLPWLSTGIGAAGAEKISLGALSSPVLFRGDAATACRDPAAIYHDGWFRLFFTLVKIEPDSRPFSYVAWSKSRDLQTWTAPVAFTPRDQHLNYGSPGNIIRHRDQWVLCLQTYPRPGGERYGNSDARIWTMRSRDLETWDEPELLRVKGADVPREAMGRMIDAYLLEDKNELGKWWCFYKQNGMSWSWSRDLTNWTYAGRISAGENACVIVDGDEYVLFHSPSNGIGVKRSTDLQHWRDDGLLTLGQKSWPWAQGRLTAGFVLDLRDEPSVGKALLFFHGSEFPENDPRGGFDNFASIGLAWSDDLQTWSWPGQDGNAGDGQHDPWTRCDVPRWGLRHGLQFALHPAGFGPGSGGPRGLVRVGAPVMEDGGHTLVNFIAVEPVVNGKRGFSELEWSKLDSSRGLRFRAEDPVYSSLAPGVEQLVVPVDVENFAGGAHVRLLLSQRTDLPDELCLTVHAQPDSVLLDACILTATMGNLTRARQLWLKGETLDSRALYPDFSGTGFAPHTIQPLQLLARNAAGDALAAITGDERDPAAVFPFPGTRWWHYPGMPVTQYWRMPSEEVQSDLCVAVNARFTYWQSQQPIPGGVSFENFELRTGYRAGQAFVFGITRQAPPDLGLGKPDPEID